MPDPNPEPPVSSPEPTPGLTATPRPDSLSGNDGTRAPLVSDPTLVTSHPDTTLLSRHGMPPDAVLSPDPLLPATERPQPEQNLAEQFQDLHPDVQSHLRQLAADKTPEQLVATAINEGGLSPEDARAFAEAIYPEQGEAIQQAVDTAKKDEMAKEKEESKAEPYVGEKAEALHSLSKDASRISAEINNAPDQETKLEKMKDLLRNLENIVGGPVTKEVFKKVGMTVGFGLLFYLLFIVWIASKVGPNK